MDIYHKINDDIIFLFKHFLNQFMYFDKIVYIDLHKNSSLKS